MTLATAAMEAGMALGPASPKMVLVTLSRSAGSCELAYARELRALGRRVLQPNFRKLFEIGALFALGNRLGAVCLQQTAKVSRHEKRS